MKSSRNHENMQAASLADDQACAVLGRHCSCVFDSQLGKGGSWEFKRQAGSILGVGNLGALASRIAWELGGRVGAQKSSLGALKKVGMEQLEVGLPR